MAHSLRALLRNHIECAPRLCSAVGELGGICRRDRCAYSAFCNGMDRGRGCQVLRSCWRAPRNFAITTSVFLFCVDCRHYRSWISGSWTCELLSPESVLDRYQGRLSEFGSNTSGSGLYSKPRQWFCALGSGLCRWNDNRLLRRPCWPVGWLLEMSVGGNRDAFQSLR